MIIYSAVVVHNKTVDLTCVVVSCRPGNIPQAFPALDKACRVAAVGRSVSLSGLKKKSSRAIDLLTLLTTRKRHTV